MKLLGVTLARTIWAIDMKALNPGGRSLLDLFQAIATRYRFSTFPKHLLDYNKNNALEFNSGTFLKGPNEDLRVGLTIYSDGVVGDSLSSTDNSEAFLEDMAQWAAKDHGLLFDGNSIVRKAHLSQLEVKFDTRLSFINPKLNFLPSRLYSQVVPFDGNATQYGFGGFAVWPENMHKDTTLHVFRLEPKWNTTFAENIYFSSAPVRTQEHVAILQEIEATLK